MFSILLWNLKNPPPMLFDEIAGLDIDLAIFLWESESGKHVSGSGGYHHLQTKKSQFGIWFAKQKLRCSIIDSVFPDAIGVEVNVKDVEPNFLIIAAHLPSNFNRTEYSQGESVRALRDWIDILENPAQEEKLDAIVVGDLNRNPFDAPIVARDGLNAISSLTRAKKLVRKSKYGESKFFYNPMWRTLGVDETAEAAGHPLGTYYNRHEHRADEYFWYVFDQILIRPALLQRFEIAELAILTKLGAQQSLLDNQDLPNGEISDHLPVLMRIQPRGV